MRKFTVFLIVIILLILSCSDQDEETGFQNSAKISLGKQLFFDKRLSENNSVACASCHQPQFGFSDNRKFSIGVFAGLTNRNSPPLNNLRNQVSFFHDGRAKSLVQQAMEVMNNPLEMGDAKFIPGKLKGDSAYVRQFQSIYKADINLFLVADALTEFERSLVSKSSAYDHFLAGDTSALTTDQKIGFKLFNTKARCVTCHIGQNLTDNQFYNIGFFDSTDSLSDKGRFLITKDSSDLGRFRTPSLRNVALSAPYFHDGQISNLREVINRYNKPNPMGEGDFKDKKLRTIHLSELEKFQLQQFLLSLSDFDFLAGYTDQSVLDSIQETQSYSRNEYERFDLLRSFNQKELYVRIFHQEILGQTGFNELKTISDSVKRDQTKINIERDYFRKEFSKLFESGDYLLFNQQINFENTIFVKANIKKIPTPDSKINLKKRIKLLNQINSGKPNQFNWANAIFDYRKLLN